MDHFVVPTLSFRLLYGLLILSRGRRHILWLGVTANPSAEWIARQLIEACGWECPFTLTRDKGRHLAGLGQESERVFEGFVR